MNEQVEKILADVGVDALTMIAREMIGDDSATLVGDLAFADIDTPHNDDRTIGIVKVSGSAVSVRHGSHHTWSSVVKIIDQSVPTNDAANWAFPENEAKVYELGLLVDDGMRLRPAKCYLAQQNNDGLHIHWLEDLSGAPQPPWNLEQFVSTANHLGQFNGYHSVNKTELPIEVSQDAYFLRASAIKWRSDYSELMELPPDDPILRRVFRDTSLEPGLEYTIAFGRALEVAKSLPHGLSFGDSHPRNLFPFGSETVGIDWASLTRDPIGCDIGVLIGSPLSFTEAEVQLSARNEQEIYESYIDGLKSSGWTGNLDHVRLGFFMQFSFYVLLTPSFPLKIEQMKKNDVRRAWAEKRFGIPFAEFPELKAQVVELIPKYNEELKLLLQRVEATL
jgi:hypothetical protein